MLQCASRRRRVPGCFCRPRLHSGACTARSRSAGRLLRAAEAPRLPPLRHAPPEREGHGGDPEVALLAPLLGEHADALVGREVVVVRLHARRVGAEARVWAQGCRQGRGGGLAAASCCDNCCSCCTCMHAAAGAAGGGQCDAASALTDEWHAGQHQRQVHEFEPADCQQQQRQQWRRRGSGVRRRRRSGRHRSVRAFAVLACCLPPPHSRTLKDSTLLVNSRMPLRTLRGKGSTSRKVKSIGGGSRKLTRNFQPVNAAIVNAAAPAGELQVSVCCWRQR